MGVPSLERVLISKCFLGVPCRYHGRAVGSPAKVARLAARYELVPVCPEELGGLPVPRPATPLRNKHGAQIRDRRGNDVSSAFIAGACATLALCLREGISRAYLCRGSPSCDRRGFAGELLERHGIHVVNP